MVTRRIRRRASLTLALGLLAVGWTGCQTAEKRLVGSWQLVYEPEEAPDPAEAGPFGAVAGALRNVARSAAQIRLDLAGDGSGTRRAGAAGFADQDVILWEVVAEERDAATVRFTDAADPGENDAWRITFEGPDRFTTTIDGLGSVAFVRVDHR